VLVGQRNDDRGRIAIDRFEPCPEGAHLATDVVAIDHDAQRQARERFGDEPVVKAEHADRGIDVAGEQGLGDVPDQGLATNLEQKLVAGAPSEVD
jgi:hypothetical protein